MFASATALTAATILAVGGGLMFVTQAVDDTTPVPAADQADIGPRFVHSSAATGSCLIDAGETTYVVDYFQVEGKS